MNIGYACLSVGVPNTNMKGCRIKNLSKEKLRELITHNLNSLENMINYNIENNIKLFRISSDIIPFGSRPENMLEWWDIFDNKFYNIGEKINANNIRVSMHPGQYTVLNSPNTDVVKKSILDLNYHARVLDKLGVGVDNKIILHIGGIYNDKKQAAKRFIENYKYLDIGVTNRLVLENDDKLYTIHDVLEIATSLNSPVVFDNLHNKINNCDKTKNDLYWISLCNETWKDRDGNQKIHYSQQNPCKKPGSHSQTIRINEFMDFYQIVKSKEIDIMLEVKDKNLSAIKCINCTTGDKMIKTLELEWSKYKYTILEKDPPSYVAIRRLLKNKAEYPSIEFYNLIENALEKDSSIGNSINAALHIWGYFKDIALDNEKDKFFHNIEMYKHSKLKISTIKNILWKLANKYQQSYLLDSYYFIL